MLLPWDEEALPRWTTSPAADDHSLRWYNLVAADDDHTCGSSLLSCTRNNINNGRREDDPCFVSHDSDECDNHDHEEADSLFSRVCEDRASFFRLFCDFETRISSNAPDQQGRCGHRASVVQLSNTAPEVVLKKRDYISKFCFDTLPYPLFSSFLLPRIIMGEAQSKARPRPDEESRRTRDGKKKRKRRPGDPPKKKKKKPAYSVEEIEEKIDEGCLQISDSEVFRELISQLSQEQQGEFLDLLLIQQEELILQYRSGASVLQPTISPKSAQAYADRKKAGEIDPKTTVLDDLKNLLAENKSKSEQEKMESSTVGGGGGSTCSPGDEDQSVQDFCGGNGSGGESKRELTREEREAKFKEVLANMKLNGAGSDSSSEYTTDEEYEADFEGKSLERVSQEADFALAEAMKMLDMDPAMKA
ncbi:unnamed protein product [Amoebophrya sp. A120]|nr:unnamed protein product [Amoebophrya sp. A120]|eukprot:GSA120T00007280001.1